MPSVYTQASERIFDELCEEDSQWLTITAQTAIKLRKGYYEPHGMIDALGQYWGMPSLPEVHSFMQLWQHLHEGDIAVTRLHVGRAPLKDAEIEGNNEILQEWVRRFGIRVEAEFWGGLADNDGYIQVLEPIKLDTVNVSDMRITVEHGGAESLAYPLEVGTQSWSKTLITLRTQGLLARWPYHSEDIWLFLTRREVRDAMMAKMFDALGVNI